MEELIRIETLVLELLLIVSIVAVLVRRTRIPYTVALVLAGLVLSLRSPLELELSPELILSLFIPPLVFEAAYHLNLTNLLSNLRTIGVLAVPGVVLTMLLVGGIVAWGTGLSMGTALLFGALIAATDPVSVVALFRKMGAPKRLEVLLEGESLFNDGTAIVLFNLALVAVTTGSFDLVQGVVDFLRVAGGGILIGLLLGWVASRFIARVDDHLVETTITTVLAFGSFLLAEQFHVSGVLAVVAAGLVNGNLGSEGMSPTTRIVVFNFWEYVAFLANSAVFLMIGLGLDVQALVSNWRPALWAVGAVLVARAVGVYGLSRLGQPVPERWRHVLFWGGLRGAIALALALSLPLTLGLERRTVIVMTFAVVLFTLLTQGMTMEWLMRRLGIIRRIEAQEEYEKRHARALAARAAYEHLERLHQEGLISSHTWRVLRPVLERRVEALTDAVQEVIFRAPELEIEEMETARREALRAQRSLLGTLRRDGIISEEAYEDLVAEVDVALESGVELWAQHALGAQPRVRHLLFVVLQEEDLESATNALALRGIPTTRVRSVGGFLGQPNHLVLVGLPEGTLGQAVEALRRATHRRVRYVHPVAEGLPLPVGEGSRVQVHGATVFVFEVARYEEI